MHPRTRLVVLALASTLGACTLPDPEARTSGLADGEGEDALSLRMPRGNASAASPSGKGSNDRVPTGGAGSDLRIDPNHDELGPSDSNESSDPASEIVTNDTVSGMPSSNVADETPSGLPIDTPIEMPIDHAGASDDTVLAPPLPSTWYDLTTGNGFASKGDVQSAFGWNDRGLTGAVCSSVTGANNRCEALFVPENLHVWFTLEAHDTYRATCEFTTGPSQKVHEITIPRHMFIDSDVSSASRANGAKAITGFNLKGPTYTQLGKKIPVVGEPCVGENGNAQNGTWTSVELVESNGGLALWVHTDLAARASDVALWQH